MAAFITLDEVKAQLNIPVNVTDDDAELNDYVEAACDMVESAVGPITSRTITGEFVDLMGRTIFNELTTAGTRAFVLRWRPVQSIQSITSAILAGVTYAPSEFIIDGGTGIVRRADGGTIFGPLVVSYTAGYDMPPGWARLAAKIIVQHLWGSQLGNSPGALPSDDTQATDPAFGAGFAMPNRAAELLTPHLLTPGIG